MLLFVSKLKALAYRSVPPLTACMNMAKAKYTHFRAYDLRRKDLHTIKDSPTNVTEHRVSCKDWAAKLGKVKKQVFKAKRKQPNKAKIVCKASDIISYDSSEIECLHCGNLGDDESCGLHCYKHFTKQFATNSIDIKGPGRYGYGAFTRPGISISKGQYLDQYLGELRPLDSEVEGHNKSLYRFEIPGVCVVDAERAGNWTRFVNSSCRPNAKVFGDFVGKRHVILFQALRNVGPEEEICINYGRHYFKRAGFACQCGHCESK